jgi:MFS family permease
MTVRSKVATVFYWVFFLDLINMFIAITFPGMSRALNASVSELAWVSNGYIAGLTLVVPFSAWLTQRWGSPALYAFAHAIQCGSAGLRTERLAGQPDFLARPARGWAGACLSPSDSL